jgi:hypothetical protein
MSTSGRPHRSQVGAFQTNGIFTHLQEESSMFYNGFCDIYMLEFNVFDPCSIMKFYNGFCDIYMLEFNVFDPCSIMKFYNGFCDIYMLDFNAFE